MHGDDHDGVDARSDDDEPMRGWVPPDDRLWLHPSERASAASRPAAAGSPSDFTPSNTRRRWVIGGLATCVVLTLIVGAMVAAATNGPGPRANSAVVFTGVPPTTEVDLSHLATTHQMHSAATGAAQSTVALVVTRSTGTTVTTGIVAEASGILVALWPSVAGARTITVVEPDGTRQSAVLVGHDPVTGIAVLRIPDDLPVAAFSATDPSTGSVAVAMSEASTPPAGRLVARLYAGTVMSAGVRNGTWMGGGMSGTTVAAPLVANDIGSPLFDRSGAVLGIFSSVVGSGRHRAALFLPAGLVRDVTSQIVAHGSVDHGRFGAGVVDPSSPGGTEPAPLGALIQSVAPGSSANQAGLEPGDRIIAVSGGDVRSVAELSTRLYAAPPGSELPVTFMRGTRTITTTVVLGDN